jgi:hypothetical protein
MDGGRRLDEKGTVGEDGRRRGGLKCRLWLIFCTAAAALLYAESQRRELSKSRD